MTRIESLLSARLFLAPQWVGDRIFFISNLTGRLSLYAMDFGGSVPEPLLPPHIALQNPHLIGGLSYYVFPRLDKILVMIDNDGDENYQPMLIPMLGGFPEPAFDNFFANTRDHLVDCDPERNIAYINAESRTEQIQSSYQCSLETGEVTLMASSQWGAFPAANYRHDTVALLDGYTVGDEVLYLWNRGESQKPVIYGVPLEQRQPGQEVPLSGFVGLTFAPGGKGMVVASAVHSDTYGLGYLDLAKPHEIKPIKVNGIAHTGVGEMESVQDLKDNRYLVRYNIDGCSWLYEGEFDHGAMQMNLKHVLVGQGRLSNGVLESAYYDKFGDRFSLSFSTATTPTQIYTIAGKDRKDVEMHTCERILGIAEELLSPGEDASYTSFDGMRVSARLYLPAASLGFEGPRPLVYYVHGGPQGQERPDFAWFSMPLIQFLTLKGFAVLVPNVRGSTGYGLNYTKQVDHDWGGQDRLDHVHAMKILASDPRVDVSRAGVVGRSYGGYMSLTMASRHPELWSAAVDMFGPYDLLTFSDRIPETWKPYFAIALGDPVKDRDFLVERSPRTYMNQLACPLLVIQGKNDPRVVERESRDVVEQLRTQGKDVEYLMFENEGHDVLKFENRVTCYNAITDFFAKHLRP
ncbi:MAG: S9 family peptidase [Chloroflexota bacterium]|nr:MAG: S9 family peptidase [Chloroflexota bacterium]